jgi:6-pyruvoyltetrahydropterin/6-carboxytetrahydropterin synthase
MSIIRITKEFQFEMAHALLGYDGPCKNIHGHSYKLDVTVKGEVKQDTSDSDEGMVVDFGIIKTLVKELIVDEFDHSLVLNEKMDIDKSQFEFMNKLILVPYQPTCELLLVDFARVIKESLPANISLHSLMLRETPTSYAEWFASEN